MRWTLSNALSRVPEPREGLLRTSLRPSGVIWSMSYSCVDVIYGIPISAALMERNDEMCEAEPDNEDLNEELECYGFETQYSGSSMIQPGWLGIKLDGFDECKDFLRVADMSFEPTEEQKAEAEKKIAALDPRLREVAEPVGVYLVFSTS